MRLSGKYTRREWVMRLINYATHFFFMKSLHTIQIISNNEGDHNRYIGTRRLFHFAVSFVKGI